MSRKPSSGVPLLISSTLFGLGVFIVAAWLEYWVSEAFLGGVA